MAVMHRKMGRKKGDSALSALNEDLRETMALIKDEELFDDETDRSPLSTAQVAEKFPALAAQKRMS